MCIHIRMIIQLIMMNARRMPWTEVKVKVREISGECFETERMFRCLANRTFLEEYSNWNSGTRWGSQLCTLWSNPLMQWHRFSSALPNGSLSSTLSSTLSRYYPPILSKINKAVQCQYQCTQTAGLAGYLQFAEQPIKNFLRRCLFNGSFRWFFSGLLLSGFQWFLFSFQVHSDDLLVPPLSQITVVD